MLGKGLDLWKKNLKKFLKTELFKLKFSLATNGLDNPMKIKEVKKDIAKINTVLTERKIAEAKA